MRFPKPAAFLARVKFKGTLLLALLVLIPYYLLSNGTFYLSDPTLSSLAFERQAGLFNYFTHLFTHVGLAHLAGNVVPLVLFGLVLEQVVGAFSLIAVFLASGILSSIAFSVLNPFVVLVGASTGVAGIMTAASMLNPRRALPLLILVPLLLLLVAPMVSFFNSFQLQSFAQERAVQETRAQTFLAQNRTFEAAQAMASAETAQSKLVQTAYGVRRESETPTDALVHFIGALIGALLIFFFKKPELRKGVLEIEEMAGWLHVKLRSNARGRSRAKPNK